MNSDTGLASNIHFGCSLGCLSWLLPAWLCSPGRAGQGGERSTDQKTCLGGRDPGNVPPARPRDPGPGQLQGFSDWNGQCFLCTHQTAPRPRRRQCEGPGAEACMSFHCVTRGQQMANGPLASVPSCRWLSCASSTWSSPPWTGPLSAGKRQSSVTWRTRRSSRKCRLRDLRYSLRCKYCSGPEK